MIELLNQNLEALQLRFIQRIRNYGTLSYTEQVQLAAQLDFFKELQGAGFSKVLDTLEQGYADIIKDVASKKVRGIDVLALEDLQLISDLDGASLLRSGEAYSYQFKSRLFKGLIQGENIRQMLSDFRIPEFKYNWNITALTTAEDEFHSIATAKIWADEPEARFKLEGVLDDRTRCECAAVLRNQPENGFTKKEIDNGEATKIVKEHCPKVSPESQEYTWRMRGGFNCRHRWEVYEN